MKIFSFLIFSFIASIARSVTIDEMLRANVGQVLKGTNCSLAVKAIDHGFQIQYVFGNRQSIEFDYHLQGYNSHDPQWVMGVSGNQLHVIDVEYGPTDFDYVVPAQISLLFGNKFISLIGTYFDLDNTPHQIQPCSF